MKQPGRMGSPPNIPTAADKHPATSTQSSDTKYPVAIGLMFAMMCVLILAMHGFSKLGPSAIQRTKLLLLPITSWTHSLDPYRKTSLVIMICIAVGVWLIALKFVF